MALNQNKLMGYLTAIIGSLIGAVSLMHLGTYLGTGYVINFMPNAELEGVIPPFIGFVVGWWMGEVVGCWLALKWRGERRVNKTTKELAILTPLGILFWVFFHTFFLTWIRGSLDDLAFLELNNKLRPITIGSITIVLAALARFLGERR